MIKWSSDILLLEAVDGVDRLVREVAAEDLSNCCADDLGLDWGESCCHPLLLFGYRLIISFAAETAVRQVTDVEKKTLSAPGSVLMCCIVHLVRCPGRSPGRYHPDRTGLRPRCGRFLGNRGMTF